MCLVGKSDSFFLLPIALSLHPSSLYRSVFLLARVSSDLFLDEKNQKSRIHLFHIPLTFDNVASFSRIIQNESRRKTQRTFDGLRSSSSESHRIAATPALSLSKGEYFLRRVMKDKLENK